MKWPLKQRHQKSNHTLDEVKHLDQGCGPWGRLRLQPWPTRLLAILLLRLFLRRRLDQLEFAEALHQFRNFHLRPRWHGVRGGRGRRGRVDEASHRSFQGRGAADVEITTVYRDRRIVRVRFDKDMRGESHLEVYKLCHSVNSCSISCYYTSYGSYTNPLSYEVW